MNIIGLLPRLTNVLLGLFVLFTVLPVKLNYSSIAIVSLSVLAMAAMLYGRDKERNPHRKLFLISLPFFVYLLGMINTTNGATGFDFVTRNASFLAFPLIFYGLGHWVNKKVLLRVFLAGLLVTDSYLIYLFVYYFNFGERFYMVVTTDIFHSTYLGMYNLVAYWVCIYTYKNTGSKLYLAMASLFILASVLASSRIVFLLAVASLVGTLLLIVKSRKKKGFMLLFAGIVTVLTLLFVPSIKQKFNQIRELDQIGFDEDNYRSISSRFAKLEASTRVLGRNFIFGTGTGDLLDELVAEYEQMKFTMGYKYRYNPHNQYLDNLIRNGIVGGGICLTVIFLYPLYMAYRHKNILLATFVLVIAGVSLTESILDVHKGITFYTFFITLLLYQPEPEGESP